MRTYRNPAWYNVTLTLVIICGIGGTAAAQWLSLPLPGTPRTADGKPNLNAPAPQDASRQAGSVRHLESGHHAVQRQPAARRDGGADAAVGGRIL